MPTQKEFKVNEYITLKLEGEKTNIYVKEQLFNQCKFLLLNIPVDKISTFDEIESIDEAAEKLDRSLERMDMVASRIPPETEFWGHCSNMQVWVEHEYDTRLLHSNLAFPLLKKLSLIGDPIAKRALKEEIMKYLKSWYLPVVSYLFQNGYLEYLDKNIRENMFLAPYPRILDQTLKRIEAGDDSIFRFINLFRLMDSFQDENWKQVFEYLNEETSGAIMLYTGVFRPEGIYFRSNRDIQLDPGMHNAMLRAYVNKRKDGKVHEFVKKFPRFPIAFEYWLGRLVIQYLEESGVEHLFCKNSNTLKENIKAFLETSDIRTIMFSTFLRYLIKKGDDVANKLLKEEIITRFLLNEKESDFIYSSRTLELVNDREITAKIIELICSKDEHNLLELFKLNDLTRYLNKQAIDSLQNKNVIVNLLQTFIHGDISPKNMILMIKKLPQFEEFIKNMSEDKREQLVKIIVDLVRKKDPKGIVIFKVIKSVLDDEETSLILKNIMNQEELVKGLINIPRFGIFEDRFFNNIKVLLLINMLKNNNFKYFTKSYSSRRPLVNLLNRISFFIKDEDFSEIQDIRKALLERLKTDDIDLFRDLINFQYLFKYIRIDDIEEFLTHIETTLEEECLNVMRSDRRFNLKIFKLYAVNKNSYALDILDFFLTTIIQDTESEFNQSFLNEPLLLELRALLVSNTTMMTTELKRRPNNILNLILEQLLELQDKDNWDFGFDILAVKFLCIAPKGINELLLSLDYQIYKKLQWEYDEIIDKILIDIRDFFPRDFVSSIFWFMERHSYDEDKFSYHIRDYVNDLNREDFWKLISSGKEVLMEIENEIDSDLFIHNNDEEPQGSGFIIANGKVEELSIWDENGVNLQQLPKTIGELTSLKRLNICYSPLSNLPTSFAKLTSLEELNLSYNNFTTLPEFIGELKSLKKLDLNGNPIKYLPESIGNLKNLQSIRMFENLLESLPESIGGLESLKSLDISNNHKNTIKTLPESIGDLKSLESFNAFGCKLETLPDSFGRLKKLRYLKLSNTRIESLPKSLKNLKNLVELDLSSSKIKEFPNWFSGLKSLATINFKNLNLKEIPRQLSELANLRDLDLASNQITEIKGLENLKKLFRLDLGFNKIKEIKGLKSLYNITMLELCNNNISEIKGLEDLPKLNRLSIGGNPIDHQLFEELGSVETKSWPYLAKNPRNFVEYCRQKLIPKENTESVLVYGKKFYIWNKALDLTNFSIGSFDEIKRLESLTDLEAIFLRKNNIREIKNLENQQKLKILDLAQNRISEIKGLEKLNNLEILNINYNQTLIEIKGLDSLKNLKKLKLNRNKITKINGLDNLINLEFLDISINKISEIENLNSLKKLKYLNLYSNEISEIKGLEHLKELKVLVLGKNNIPKEKLLEYKFNFEIKEFDFDPDDTFIF